MTAMKPPSKSSSVRLFSKEGIASIGFVVSLSGITLTSIQWGAQSTAYYLALASGFLLALPLLSQALVYRHNLVLALIILSFTPLLLYSLQTAFLSAPEFKPPSLLFTLAISGTTAFAILFALLPGQGCGLAMMSR